MKISKNSWHYKLASIVDDFKWNRATNFCNYFWSVILGAGIVTIAATAAIYIIACFADLFVWIYVVLFVGYVDMHEQLAVVAVAILLVAAVICIIILSCFVRQELRITANTKTESAPGFFTLAYLKFKDKTCIKLEFDE